MTLSYGVALVFFAHTGPVAGTALYKLTLAHFGNDVLSLWGIIAIAVTIANTIGIIVRKRWLGTSVAFAGFGLWTYSLILYAFGGFWLQVFFTSLPNMFFWGWYYVVIVLYHDYEDESGESYSVEDLKV